MLQWKTRQETGNMQMLSAWKHGTLPRDKCQIWKSVWSLSKSTVQFGCLPNLPSGALS